MTFPLQGVKILDLSRYLPGPFCSMVLGDMGADVLRIESHGSNEREVFDWVFHTSNRNKQSITLNLKSEQGLEIFYRLVSRADVVLESFRPGVTKRLGIDYESLRRHKSDIIYCSITGYGQDGPYRDFPGHDLNYMGVAGILGLNDILTGPLAGKEDVLIRPGISVSDLSTSMYSALSIVAAIHQRDKNGQGMFIDCAIADTMTAWMITRVGNYLVREQQPSLAEMGLLAPTNRVYMASDGKYLSIAAVEDHFWVELCKALELQSYLEDPRFETHKQRTAARDELIPVLEAAFKTKTSTEWLGLFLNRGVPCAPVNLTVEDVFKDPQIIHRNLVREVTCENGDKMKQIVYPVKLGGLEARLETAPPSLGRDNETVMTSLGYSKEEINELKQKGII